MKSPLLTMVLQNIKYKGTITRITLLYSISKLVENMQDRLLP